MDYNVVSLCLFITFFHCFLNTAYGIPLRENVPVLSEGKHDRVTRQAAGIGNPPILGSNTNRYLSNVIFHKPEQMIPKQNTNYNEVKNNIKESNVEQGIITTSTRFQDKTFPGRADVVRAEVTALAAVGATGGAATATAVAATNGGAVATEAAVGIKNGVASSHNALNTGAAANTGANANGVNGVTNTNGGFGTNTGVGLNTITVLNLDERRNNKNGLNININPAVAVNGEGKLASSSASVESGPLVGGGFKTAASALALSFRGDPESSLNANQAQVIQKVKDEVPRRKYRPYSDRYEEVYDPYSNGERDDLYDWRRPSQGKSRQEKEIDRLVKLLESLRNLDPYQTQYKRDVYSSYKRQKDEECLE